MCLCVVTRVGGEMNGSSACDGRVSVYYIEIEDRGGFKNGLMTGGICLSASCMARP